jgi:hypothetical protein
VPGERKPTEFRPTVFKPGDATDLDVKWPSRSGTQMKMRARAILRFDKIETGL